MGPPWCWEVTPGKETWDKKQTAEQRREEQRGGRVARTRASQRVWVQGRRAAAPAPLPLIRSPRGQELSLISSACPLCQLIASPRTGAPSRAESSASPQVTPTPNSPRKSCLSLSWLHPPSLSPLLPVFPAGKPLMQVLGPPLQPVWPPHFVSALNDFLSPHGLASPCLTSPAVAHSS